MNNTLVVKKIHIGIYNGKKGVLRMLSCKECFRLMGVKDNDFYKIAKNQIDSSLYHLAGDSIVCYGVLTSIFAQLFNIDTTDKVNTDIEWWKT